MSDLMREYIAENENKKELIEKLVQELKDNNLRDEDIITIVDNFIKKHGDDYAFVRDNYAKEVYENRRKL